MLSAVFTLTGFAISGRVAKRNQRECMAGKPTEFNSAARRHREILLGCLETAGCVAIWPCGDGLTVEDVLDTYPEAVARGKVPAWQQLLCRHSSRRPTRLRRMTAPGCSRRCLRVWMRCDAYG